MTEMCNTTVQTAVVRVKLRIGVGNGTEEGSVSIHDLIQLLPYNSIQLVFEMDRIKNLKTNVATLIYINKSEAAKRRIYRALPALIENNVIIKVSTSTYLLNPLLFIPSNSVFNSVLDLWIGLGGKV